MFRNRTKKLPTNDLVKNKSFSGIGFLVATLGAAVGLGNIWKFPYLVAQYSGAFFIPFILGLFLIGIPILILEINIGKRMRSSSAKVFKKLNPRAEIFGWMQALTAGAVGIYYAVIIGWSLIALIQSFIPHYFNTHANPIIDFSKTTHLSTINWVWLLSLAGAWIIVSVIVILGIKKGIEKTNMWLMPLLFIMLIAVTIYACTLSGASKGIEYLFRIDGSKLLSIGIWKAAFGQVFFSLCVGSGVIITYAKHSPANQDTNNVALTLAFGNTLVAIISSILVFAALGFKFHNQSVVSDFGTWFTNNEKSFGGPPLIFGAFPSIFGQLMATTGYFGNIVAIVFFLTIIFAAITSIISIGMTVVDNLSEKSPKFKEKHLMMGYALFSFIIGIVLTLNVAPGIIDSFDFWISQNFMVLSGAIECILIFYVFRKTKLFKEFGNKRSLFRVNYIWEICIGVIAPITLIVIWGWGFFQGTFSASVSNMSLERTGIICGACIAVAIISLLVGYFMNKNAKISNKWKKITRFFFYYVIPIVSTIMLFWLSFNMSIAYGNYSPFIQYVGFFIPFVIVVFGSFFFKNLKEKAPKKEILKEKIQEEA